jgi:hypothetical protein
MLVTLFLLKAPLNDANHLAKLCRPQFEELYCNYRAFMTMMKNVQIPYLLVRYACRPVKYLRTRLISYHRLISV